MNRAINLNQALIQQLQSLEHAGVKDLPKPRRVSKPTLSSAASVAAIRKAASPAEGLTSANRSAEDRPARSAETAQPVMELESRPVERRDSSGSLDDRIAALRVLQSEVAGCTRCPELVRSRTQTVFGVGNVRPQLCFFGEAPGADEDAQGEPFVGRAGQLLNKIIAACRMTREEVYILNAVKCRPQKNRTPVESEIECCSEYFRRQLEILRPEFICCLGGVAVRALLKRKDSIGKMRGQLFDYRESKVVVTYHPAFLLRDPSAKRFVWEDMQFLMNAMGRPIG